MDKSKIYDMAPVLLMFGGMAVSMLPGIPKNLKSNLALSSMGLAFAWIIVVEVGFRLKASEYAYIEAICRPSQKKLHLWIKEPKEGIRSRIVDEENETYETPLELAEKIGEYGIYEDIDRIDVEHDLPWEERMIFMPGQAYYKGYPIPHNKCAQVEFWEPEKDGTRFDFLDPIPRFLLSSAPRDWYLLQEPPQVAANNGKEGNPVSSVEVGKLKEEVRTWKTRFLNEQQKRVRLHGMVESLENQFEGAISRARDVTKLVLEELVTLLAAHTTISEAIGEVRQRKWMSLTLSLVLLLMGGGLIVTFAVRPDFRQWITANSGLIIIIAILVVVGIYYWRRRR